MAEELTVLFTQHSRRIESRAVLDGFELLSWHWGASTLPGDTELVGWSSPEERDRVAVSLRIVTPSLQLYTQKALSTAPGSECTQISLPKKELFPPSPK